MRKDLSAGCFETNLKIISFRFLGIVGAKLPADGEGLKSDGWADPQTHSVGAIQANSPVGSGRI